jgi:hypothetical protein
MASKFTDSKKWEEDWFNSLGGEYQLLWNYITDMCSNTGIWKPNKSGFEMRTKFKVNLDSFLQKVNADKERILRLEDGTWYLTGYIKFQWFNKKKSFDLVLSNKLHLSIITELKEHKVPLQKVRGLREVLQTSMVMEVENGGIGIEIKKEPKIKIDFKPTEPEPEQVHETPIEVFPAAVIWQDEMCREHLQRMAKAYRIQDVDNLLQRWEGWYMSKFDWKKKELNEYRKSFEGWIIDPKSRQQVVKATVDQIENRKREFEGKL